ncbi:MAG: hypothetical protein IMW97_01610 [Firmicutes bacterium]|nr:hypothetical protein [Candidatus Fermentithermobacillaceae bacterium]
MNEVARLGLLKDLYEGLLAPRQREVARLKLDEDLSFSEIACELGISRGAAQDAFQSCVEALNRFEQEIGFLKYSQEVNQKFKRLKKLLESMDQSNWTSVKAEALRLLEEAGTASEK